MGTKRLFVLGGTGFIGRETVREAAAQGWSVTALARSEEKADRLRALGAETVLRDAAAPGGWIGAARGTDVLVDLAQPELPSRIRPRDIQAVAAARLAATRALLEALATLGPGERPVLVSVSGTDDLAPDERGRIDGRSPLRAEPVGFGHVGAPVRRLVEASGIASTHAYLGTVYGPGKSFAATVFPRLARGRMLLPTHAGNRLPMIHVRDAARAIVHLAGLGKEAIAGRSWILVDEAGGAELAGFFEQAASLMGVAAPRRAPAWLLSIAMGRILLETLTRDVRAAPSDLLATGFRFEYPTIREGLPATLDALGYLRAPRPPPGARPARWWALLAVTLAAVAAVNALDLPLGVPRLRALAGGAPILDMRIHGYTPAEAYRLLELLGPVGRRSYGEMLWTVDLLLPALFSALLWASLSRGRLRRWRWAGLLGGAADYAENAAITLLLTGFPAHRDALARLASGLTISKFTLYLAGVALAAAGALAARRRGPGAPSIDRHRESAA
jgi:nucleoside-diphosphate-sugar epimerase